MQMDTVHLPPHTLDVAQRLAHIGFLLLDKDCLSFISPLHEEYFRYHHYRYQYNDVSEMPQDIHLFLQEVIRRMSCLPFTESLNVNKHQQVLERQYQNEFYR